MTRWVGESVCLRVLSDHSPLRY